jgi:hypothetical protein
MDIRSSQYFIRGNKFKSWQLHRHLWAHCLKNVGSSVSQAYETPPPFTGIALLYLHDQNTKLMNKFYLKYIFVIVIVVTYLITHSESRL